jgi:hypothetical protein
MNMALELVLTGRKRKMEKQMTDFEAHLTRQMVFSKATFGPGSRTKGVIDHIRKELVEVEESEGNAAEWVDVVILALDGLMRAIQNQHNSPSGRVLVYAHDAAVQRFAPLSKSKGSTNSATGLNGARNRKTRPLNM